MPPGQPAKMDDIRRQLDELMGADRDGDREMCAWQPALGTCLRSGDANLILLQCAQEAH